MNEIVKADWIKTPHEIVKKMTTDEAAITYAMINALDKGAKEELRDKLFKSTLNKITLTLPNGVQQEIIISRGTTTIKTVKNKVIDYKKAIDFAIDHGYKLPMVPEQIIPEHVDESKLEDQDWFQEHIEDFITVKEEVKETKSSDRIIVKDVK